MTDQGSEIYATRLLSGMTRQVGNEIDEFVTPGAARHAAGPAAGPGGHQHRPRPRCGHAFAQRSAHDAVRPLRPGEALAGAVHQLDRPGQPPAQPRHQLRRHAEEPHHGLCRRGSARLPARHQLHRRSSGPTCVPPTGRPTRPHSARRPPPPWATPRSWAAAATQRFNDIDLWLGGLAEAKVAGGMLGSTFDFIFATQMAALRDADRFYYEAACGRHRPAVGA